MKDGAIFCNSGHFDVEIQISELRKIAKSTRTIREFTEEFVMADGRRLYLLGEGRLVNLAAAEGHPASVMDMSFANQSLAAEYIVNHGKELENTVYSMPEDLDQEVARLKLNASGIKIDTLTPEQEKYLNSWQMGT
jgi:adenosylhomocysteinase